MITYIKKITILLFILLTYFSLTHADENQDLQNIYKSLLPDFQKLTPEASALGQYGKYSASGYTGVPHISVPLFSIGSSNFSMPIELNYDASGIKVEQQATYVGLGWNLMMGGNISQIVCGQSDFYETSHNISISNLDLLQTVLPDVKNISYPLCTLASVEFPAISNRGSYMPIEADQKKYDILQAVSNGAKVPDIFQASFCGHSVSFVIDTSNKKAGIIGNDATNYKIELKEYTGAYPHSIEITDDHGLKYLFTEAPQNTMEDRASYNLSTIKNAADQSLAEFKYLKESCDFFRPYYETVGKPDESYGKPIGSESIRNQFINRNYPYSLLEHVANEYYPETIITDKETVTFTYGNREDVKQAKRIDKITVQSNSNNNSIIHNVIFNYGNFTESNYDSELSYRYGYTSVYSYNRLKLTDITVDGKKYSFGYNEDIALPSRLSVQQDFWGYYNGERNTDGFCASPKYKYDNNNKLIGVETVGPANRYASKDLCEAGTLNKIIYPTGGYTKFDYEINQFDDIDGKNYYPSATSTLSVEHVRTESCASGYTGRGYKTTADTNEFDIDQPTKVDIASSTPYYPSSQQYYRLCLSIIGKDANGNTVFSRYYDKYNDKQDFKESCELPKGHYVLSSLYASVASGLITGGSIKVSFPPEYNEDLSIAGASGKSIGGGMRIKKIENYDNNNTLLGSTLYKYEGGRLLVPTVQAELIPMMSYYVTMAANLDTNKKTVYDCRFFFITSNPTYPAICSLGCPNVGYSKVTKESYDKNGQLMSYDIEKYNNKGYNVYFNMFGVNVDGLNGKLTESMTYSKDNTLMDKVSYSYSTIGLNPALNDMVFFPWARCLDTNPGSTYFDTYYKYSLYPKYPICALPQSVTETNYINGKPMSPVTTSYEYKESNYQPKFISKSNGYESSSTNIWYPEDGMVISKANNTLKTELQNKGYNPDAMLNNKHCISEKTIEEESRNGSLRGGYLNLYEELPNGLPVIEKSYSIQPSHAQLLEIEITDYDNYGNIREYKKKDGTPVTIIWSYNHQYPVMEIVGRKHNDFNNEIMTQISDLEGRSDVSPDVIRNLYNSLIKQKYQGVMINAYIYSPEHTISSIIQPNGNETKYSYDSYGRLIMASDASDNILQKYIYNYKK